MTMNNLLYVRWESYLRDDIAEALKNLSNSVCIIDIKINGYKIDVKYEELIHNTIKEKKYDVVFTINYIPEVSNLCEKYSVKYISWTYDAPCAMLYDRSVKNKCNRIYTFDRNVVDELLKEGIENVYYMPLASSKVFINTDVSKQIDFRYDISFVGSTYEKMLNMYNQCMVAFPDYLKGYLKAVIDSQLLLDGSYILEDAISIDVENQLKSILNLDLGEGYLKSYKSFFANYVLGAKTTALQREGILNLLSNNYNVDLFTGDYNKDTLSQKIVIHKPVSYGERLAKVYQNSKINLNITMANIQQGIPLRVFDIMGSGGFVMTNYRPGLEDHFIDGEDLVVYYDRMDLINKIEYYLSHDEERKIISENGRRKIKSEYTVDKKINDIFM